MNKINNDTVNYTRVNEPSYHKFMIRLWRALQSLPQYDLLKFTHVNAAVHALTGRYASNSLETVHHKMFSTIMIIEDTEWKKMTFSMRVVLIKQSAAMWVDAD